MHAGVCQRVHFVHHKRRYAISSQSRNTRRALTWYSVRKMPAGEAQDGKWRRHSVRHDLTWFRELCRGSQDLPFQVSRSEYCLSFVSFVKSSLTRDRNLNIELIGMRPNPQGARTRADLPAVGDTRPVPLAPTVPLQPMPPATLPGNQRMPTAY
jgi:hypothetical protein